MSSLPQVGSAFPAPEPKKEVAAAPAVTNGKFAAYIGTYDVGPLGVLVVKQEGEKLFGIPPNGDRVELVPDATADKFVAQPVGAPVVFERDATGKVVGVLLSLPGGREAKGKRVS